MVSGGAVEGAAGGGELVLDIGEFVLQRLEIGAGLEVGIAFGERQQRADGTRQFGLTLGAATGGMGTGGDDRVERLIGIEQGFHGKKIRALFHGGDLIIALEADELFESGSLDASSDRAKMAEMIGQFVSLATLATSLNERPRG